MNEYLAELRAKKFVTRSLVSCSACNECLYTFDVLQAMSRMSTATASLTTKTQITFPRYVWLSLAG